MTSYYVVQLLTTFARTDSAACDAFWAEEMSGLSATFHFYP